jgi:hypothetical protein
MTVELVSRAPADDVARRATATAKRRNAEANDALDFLFLGDEHGRHAKRCVHALSGREPCSRTYDPRPHRQAGPDEPRFYEGTGVGALYGLPNTECHLWQLAGWNIVPRSSR